MTDARQTQPKFMMRLHLMFAWKRRKKKQRDFYNILCGFLTFSFRTVQLYLFCLVACLATNYASETT